MQPVPFLSVDNGPTDIGLLVIKIPDLPKALNVLVRRDINLVEEIILMGVK
jgi:hypothetical protein